MRFNNSDQLKAFLKKESKRLNISITNVYNTFFAREFLYRLSRHNDNAIILKGSAAQLPYLGKLTRAVTDLDLATPYSSTEIFSILIDSMHDNESIPFNFEFATAFHRTPTGIYKLPIVSEFGSIKHHLNIDFHAHYNWLIEGQERIMPKIFEGDCEFPVYVPSFEEFLAAKLCIVVESNKPDVLNTRVKDFYDIYQLHGGKYDAERFTEYFKKMIQLRGKITIDQANTQILNHEFIEKHSEIWESTRRKYDFLDKEIDLEGAIYYTRGVLREQLQKSGQEMPINENIKYYKLI